MLKKIQIKIDDDTNKIFKILKKSPNSYIVGGYIRDRFLGIEPKDCDFCTDLSLEKLLELFSIEKEIEIKIISERLNIIQIRYKNKKYEIARLRQDLKYYDSRKNFDFIFTNDIEKDLPRRDFTINSMAYDGENLIYIDEQCLEDIEKKLIRFVGSAKARILEDPFRMLRLFRFFSEKSLLNIDSNALEEISKHKNLIWTLPKEMIQEEFIRIVKGKNYLETFKYINQVELFDEKFYIENFQETYNKKLQSLFKNSDFKLLEKLNFSEKIIQKIKNKNNI